MRERAATSFRALASPVSVVSLVVLVLNDHLLKQAWPGVVTGKLSDVAGLVVAPLLLTVGLTATGVRRPCTWACGLTAAAFTVVKVSPAAAAVVSGWWSLTGFPTVMRADPTDLLALPAVSVAWPGAPSSGPATEGRMAAGGGHRDRPRAGPVRRDRHRRDLLR